MRRVIAVAGSSECSDLEGRLAYEVGRLLAGRDIVVACGGLGGVIDAASSTGRAPDF